MGFEHYQAYGIDRAWVEKLRKKAKDPLRKEKLKSLSEGLTKGDLQDPGKVKSLFQQGMKVLGEKPTAEQTDQVVRYVVNQRIDPQNMLHLLKLWNMFR